MTGIYGIMVNSGRTGLLMSQRAMEATGHNIANANTPGYTRQRIILESREPFMSESGLIGSGVQAADIERVRDRYLDSQIRNQQQRLGNWEAQQGALERVEIVFNESGSEGINAALSSFFDAWQDLSSNPTGHTERVVLLGKSEMLTQTINRTSEELIQIQDDLDTTLKGTVVEINQITAQISDLNLSIAEHHVAGRPANDYLDKREQLLNQLSSKIDINVSEDDNARVTVLTSGGYSLVGPTGHWDLAARDNGSGFHNVYWVDSNGNNFDITDRIAGGKLKGLVQSRDNTIPGYRDQLDTLTGELIDEVNQLHFNGFGLIDAGTGNPHQQNNFFSGSNAADFAVHSDIIADVNRIAAASTPGGVPGDNSNASAIAGLQNEKVLSGNTTTFNDYYRSLVGNIGNDSMQASIRKNHESDAANFMSDYRETISGVSLDEEMLNLLKFQYAYEAAAKLISTVDEMMETVINI